MVSVTIEALMGRMGIMSQTLSAADSDLKRLGPFQSNPIMYLLSVKYSDSERLSPSDHRFVSSPERSVMSALSCGLYSRFTFEL